MLLLILIILLIGFLMYNQLRREQNQVKNAFSTVSVILNKRYDLVPNLVETVKGYASHEKEVFEKLTELRSKLKDNNDTNATVKLDGEMNFAIKNLFAVVEKYPDIKANEHFLDLQKTLVSLEDELSAARRTYNAAVTEYNTSIQSFPIGMLAKMFHMQEMSLFTIEASIKELPKIDINK